VRSDVQIISPRPIKKANLFGSLFSFAIVRKKATRNQTVSNKPVFIAQNIFRACFKEIGWIKSPLAF
jgi:hypothetical protein